MHNITSEHTYYEDNSESKFQAKIYPYDKSFEKQEDELKEFREKHHDELTKFSSEKIQNEVLNITS